MKSPFIIAIVAVAMIGMIIPSAFADSDYSKIKIKDATTQILEFDKYQIIRTSLTIVNDDSEKFRTYNTYLTADDTIHYETSSSYDIDEIGDKTCPHPSIEINPGLEEDYVFCFQVPKSFSNNFELKFMSTNSERCAEASTNQYITCQKSTYPLSQISNPTKISYNSLLETYVKDFENMDARVSNVELISGDEINLLIMTLSISNKGNTEISGYSIDITARTLSGLEFDTDYYYDMDCDSSIDDINPGLTKTSMLCFEVPKNETAFNLILRSDFGYDNNISNCDNDWNDCNELFINIIAPEPVVEPKPEPAPNPSGIASFVDTSKDPQSYVDRYNNEPTYKEWFDANYPQYDSIYEAVGLKAPQIASFVDTTKDPRTYLVRYYTEPEYQKWFDANFPNTSIENAVDYPYKIVTDEYYVNSLFGFAIKKPTNLIDVEEHATTVSESKSLVAFFFGGNADWTSAFNVNYNSNEIQDIYYDDLVYYYSEYPNSVNPYIEQIKINNQSVEENNDGSYEVRYDFVAIESYPEDYFSDDYRGTTDSSHMSMVILLYPNGDEYVLILDSPIDTYDVDVQIFNESVDSFYSGQTENISNIINVDISNTPVVQKSNEPQISESVAEYVPEPVSSIPNCGPGTQLVNGICKVIQTEEKSSGGGCLIATATYGSEMSQQVQQLRELRDNQLLNTASGTQFMSAFNDIYYSFSPTIADMEREHPMFKEIVKLVITPMISSLSLMENAETESEVLGIGLSVIALNLAMYLGAPAIVIVGIRKKF